jgi:succinate-semialdehyde dehydrogenase/glutarate-semialdehyde dehydrogenase
VRRKEEIVAIATVNPATGETVKTYDEMSEADVERSLAAAAAAHASYRLTSFDARAERMRRAAGILDDERDQIAAMMTTEMGKTLSAARQEAAKCASACRYYADHAAGFLADEPADAAAVGAQRAFVRYQPLGPVLAVMPWNFPLWQVMRFAAPALMAGNVGLLKHASNVPGCALALQEIFRRAGFPAGAFQTLLMSPRRVARVIADDRVKAVTLTGSDLAGSQVAGEAGKHIKKTVMELGGSDPFIVLPSADLGVAVRTAITARNLNNGQSCIAAKRFIVHARVYDEFERRMVDGLERLKVGDPMDAATDVGPLATAQILETIQRQVDESVTAGARLLTGGKRLDRPGNFYQVSALAGIPQSAPAYREEVFGPVALLFKARDLDEAIELANASDYGLGSSAWTNDSEERRRCVEELEAGATFINAMVVSDPRLPFGGVKRSGYGRELARHGIREFVNVKGVSVTERAAGAGSHTE